MAKYNPEVKTVFLPIGPDGDLDFGFIADSPQELVAMCKLGRNERVAEFRFVRTIERPKRARKKHGKAS